MCKLYNGLENVLVFFPLGKTIGTDLGEMENYFQYIILLSNKGLDDCQAIGRDRKVFITKE